MQVRPCIFKINQNLSEDANYVDQRIKPALIRKADAGGNEGIENKKFPYKSIFQISRLAKQI